MSAGRGRLGFSRQGFGLLVIFLPFFERGPGHFLAFFRLSSRRASRSTKLRIFPLFLRRFFTELGGGKGSEGHHLRLSFWIEGLLEALLEPGESL